ncbi:MAG: SDR family oxidoreductase [Chloroflexi bacterium]|nr:SDR family oxidoreductase [Chloroflexota bacterium]
MDFANRNFIVTGAASGIGLATARLLKQRGARLALWDRNAEALEQAARELDARAMCADITLADDVQAAIDESTSYLGALNGVVHSAGVLHAATFHDAPLEAHRRTVEVNLIGTINVAYAALPLLKESRGSLVLVASTAAFYGPPEYTSYGASKAGVLNFAQALRVELAGTGVHVGVVCPLFVSSPMLHGYNGNTRLLRSRSPLVDVRPPEAVASAILDGIARRRFMIWPGWKPRLIFWLSRYASALGHPLSVMTYHQGGG